jgi:hypothetical protein
MLTGEIRKGRIRSDLHGICQKIPRLASAWSLARGKALQEVYVYEFEIFIPGTVVIVG